MAISRSSASFYFTMKVEQVHWFPDLRSCHRSHRCPAIILAFHWTLAHSETHLRVTLISSLGECSLTSKLRHSGPSVVPADKKTAPQALQEEPKNKLWPARSILAMQPSQTHPTSNQVQEKRLGSWCWLVSRQLSGDQSVAPRWAVTRVRRT